LLVSQAILSRYRHKFSGILNGIDNGSWSPESDPFLPAHFTASDRRGKEDCKRLLLEELGLPYAQPRPAAGAASGAEAGDCGAGSVGRPLLAVVSRLTVQKGLPLIEHGIRAAIARGAQVRGKHCFATGRLRAGLPVTTGTANAP
jgi:starch synthase